VSSELMQMKRGPCAPEYEPLSIWQCEVCGFLQDEEEDLFCADEQASLERDGYHAPCLPLYCWHCECECVASTVEA
jgi:hypothetical protein